MKRIIVISMLILLLTTSGVAENVVKQEVAISIFGEKRSGIYTGSLNEKGEPDGYGAFEAINAEGVRWHYIGEWDNGKITGDGWETWESGQTIVGAFEDNRPITVTRFLDTTDWQWLDYSDSFYVNNELVVRIKVYINKQLRFDGYYFPNKSEYYKGTRYNVDGTIDCTGYFNGYSPAASEPRETQANPSEDEKDKSSNLVEGVHVKQGVYSIGDDIPAGRWNIRPADGASAVITICSGLTEDGVADITKIIDTVYLSSETSYGFNPNKDISNINLDLLEGRFILIELGNVIFSEASKKPVLGFE